MTENKALALAPLITPFAFTFYAYISDIPKKIVNFFTIVFGSIFVADIPMLLIWPVTQGNEFYLTLQLFSFVGLMVGLNCWFLINLDKFKAKFKNDN